MPDVKEDGPTAVLPSDELQPGREVGGYVIDGKIGEGGMGVVYGARHPRIGKRAAIKVLAPMFCGDPSTVSRFEQEARLVNEIRHPNIVDVFQFGELADKRSFFVMEWLDGEALSARIERGPLTVDETVEILDVICDALEAAHEHGVIHRDLKADNVFIVTSRGKRTVKLLDFGLAKLSGRGDPASVAKTRSGVLVGTPSYMSPEQARGKSIDTRTDIYSLGVLAYKMLTRRLPFTADNPMDMILQHLKTPPPDPMKHAPATPPELARMIVRMMAKSADDRPTLAELRALFAKLRAAPAKPAGRRMGGALIGASVVLAGVIALGAVWWVQKGSDDPAAKPATSEPPPTTVAALPPQAPPPAPEPTAGSSAAIAAPSEPVAIDAAIEPAVVADAAAPAIEIHAAGSGSSAPVKPTGPRRHSARPGTSDVAPVWDVSNRPGVVMLMLERTSTIEIDGSVVAQQSKGGRFEVRAGHHEIHVKTAGRSVVVRSVDVEGGGTAVIRIGDDTGDSGDPD